MTVKKLENYSDAELAEYVKELRKEAAELKERRVEVAAEAERRLAQKRAEEILNNMTDEQKAVLLQTVQAQGVKVDADKMDGKS